MLTDAAVVLVLCCFLTSPKMTFSDKKEDSFYIMPLLDPREVADHFVPVPKVLNCPVHDVDAHLEEVGMYALGPQVSIQNSLANLLECSVADYRKQICHWLHDWALEVPMIEKWIVIRGMNLQEYLDLLSTGMSVDSLELWAVSIAMNILISVIMEDSIWSTDHYGVDLDGKCFILANYTDFVPCALDRDAETVEEELAAAAPPHDRAICQACGVSFDVHTRISRVS